MSEQARGTARRCEVCGGEPSWICPRAEVALCGGCLIRPGIAGGIDHAIPGSRAVCSHWFDGETGKLRIFIYVPAQQ